MKVIQNCFELIHKSAENSTKLLGGVLDDIIVDAMDTVENKEV